MTYISIAKEGFIVTDFDVATLIICCFTVLLANG